LDTLSYVVTRAITLIQLVRQINWKLMVKYAVVTTGRFSAHSAVRTISKKII